jgi:hypothetical protein
MKIQPSVIMWRNLTLPPKVAPAEVSERRVYAAAARFVTLLPPEDGVPGQRQIAPVKMVGLLQRWGEAADEPMLKNKSRLAGTLAPPGGNCSPAKRMIARIGWGHYFPAKNFSEATHAQIIFRFHHDRIVACGELGRPG